MSGKRADASVSAGFDVRFSIWMIGSVSKERSRLLHGDGMALLQIQKQAAMSSGRLTSPCARLIAINRKPADPTMPSIRA